MQNWDGFTQAMEHFSQLPIYISDSSAWNTSSLRGDLSRLKALYGIRWFVLDYLYLMTDNSGADEIERTAQISKGLKRAAMELDLAGVAVHSMNKGGMSSDRPKKESLRGSGQVVYDADLITFLTPYSEQVGEIDGEWIKPADRENMRVLWFDKGRELEDSRKFIKYVKLPGYPFFAEHANATPAGR
jgi:replicative DNA helicase